MKAFSCRALLTLLMMSGVCHANCYRTLDLEAFTPPPQRDVVVALDETTILGEALSEDLKRHLATAFRPGDRISLFAFSGLTRERHLRELLAVEIERVPSAKTQDNMPMRRLRALSACVKDSQRGATAALQTTAVDIFKDASTRSHQTSEIVLSLREVGVRLKASKAPEKVLLLVTDGGEHSGLMSFYKNKDLRVIDAPAALQRVAEQSLLADFGAARIYVLGLGLAVGEQTRDQAVVLSLESFWAGYFKRSNAGAVVIGKPALLVPID